MVLLSVECSLHKMRRFSPMLFTLGDTFDPLSMKPPDLGNFGSATTTPQRRTGLSYSFGRGLTESLAYCSRKWYILFGPMETISQVAQFSLIVISRFNYN